MRVTTAVLIAWALLSGASALADSDGYFCAGNGYLAYETRWVGESGSHILQIVRFGEELGVEKVEPVELEDFQVHRMTCGAGFIGISGGSGSHYVDISDIGHPTIATGHKPYKVTSVGHHGNLGHWSKESVLDLRAGDTRGRFQLVILKAHHPAKGGIEHHTIAELIERDSQQRILRSLRLFAGIFHETVH